MKKTTTLVIVLLLGIVASWGYQVIQVRSSQAQNVAPAIPLKIAVVDVAKVLSKCQENQDHIKATQQREQQIKQKLDKLQAEADAIEADLKNAVQPGTKEYSQKLQTWFDKRALIEAQKQGQKQAFSSESQAWMQSLYAKFIDQITKIAQQENISLVLGKDSSPLQNRTLADLYSLISTRKMLYNAPSLDLTDKVLNNLDKQYELGRINK